MRDSASIACLVITALVPALGLWIFVRWINRGKKRPARYWIKAAALILVVGYPLSFGPACWLNYWTGAGRYAMAIVYRPLCWTWVTYPDLGTPVLFYAKLGIGPKVYLNWDPDEGPAWARQP